jgi:hypothetical protein
MTAEQIKMAAQVILAAIVVFTVLTVMGVTFYGHFKKRPFPQQTINLVKWLIKVLVCLLIAAGFSGSGLSIISTLLR